jgi:hypothetical protein
VSVTTPDCVMVLYWLWLNQIYGTRRPLSQKIEAVEKTGILSRSGVASSGGVAYDL